MDLVVQVPRLPAVGETVGGGVLGRFRGGKGANQAVAAARLGSRVAMVGRVGDDAFGREILDGLRDEGVDLSHTPAQPGAATGVALIGVDRQGQNIILVAPGANAELTTRDVQEARHAILAADVLLLQLEIPMEPILTAAHIARGAGVLVCLDPAPALALPDDLYRMVDVLNPNEVEAAALARLPAGTIEEVRSAARSLSNLGPRTVVVTMGRHGAFYLSSDEEGHMPAHPVTAVDATAAGDAFAAALGVGLAEGKPLPEAVRFANLTAGLKVARMGAQSMPTRAQVDALLRGA